VCHTTIERLNKEKTITVGTAKCKFCDFEIDCPTKEHVHG